MRTLRLIALAGLIGMATGRAGAGAQDAPPARTQAPETAPTPAPGRRLGPAPIVSPEVHADRTVTFRLRAPNATKVTVSGEWPGGEKALVKDEQGVWSVTVG